MHSRPRALLALCVTSLTACFDADNGVIIDPVEGGVADVPSDVARVTPDVASPVDVSRVDGSTVDGATSDTAVSDASGVDGATADGSRADASTDGASSDAASADGAVSCASSEQCDNGLDDNCNGAIDEGCVCIPGATQRCYGGPPGVAGRGACSYGMSRCTGTGEFGSWGACEGSVNPSDERCDGVDNDCDGAVDEGFCRIDGACVRDGEVNPTNVCEVCRAPESSAAPTTWSARPAGTVCRAATSVCDLTETCEGTRCPADSFTPGGTICRPSIGACDRSESCTGSSAACPDDARAPSGTTCRPAAGACDVAEACDGTGVDCPVDALAPAGRVCRASATLAACDPAESCTGRAAACPNDVVTRAPMSEVCGNSVDDDCDGVVDNGCRPCISGMATSSPWQMHRLMGPVCFGRSFSQHGDPGEYAFAAIPSEGDAGWRAVTSATIDFAESSALCGRSCSCLDGGEFTYFQTFFDVSAGYAVSSLTVTMSGVDDGARVTVFNSSNPSGVVDAGSYILLGGTSVSTNLARFIVPGRNRIVITHIDDCCSDRSLSGVRVVLNGAPLTTCP